MIVQTLPLGFSLNPIHYVKKAAHAVVHPISTVKSAAKTVAHDVTHPISTAKGAVMDVGHTAKGAAVAVGHAVKTGIIKPFEWVASKVTAPIRNRVHTLRNRRAAKLAWDSRKSKTPNAAEQSQAKAWTKSHLKHQGPQGYLLALFAGSEAIAGYGAGLGYSAQFGDPATISLIAASIPVFMALMNSVLKKADKSGEAPANPGADAAAIVSSGSASPPAGADAGGADVGADAGGADASAADDGGGGGDGGAGAIAKKMGISKKQLMIGGGVIGGLLLLVLLMPSKKSS